MLNSTPCAHTFVRACAILIPTAALWAPCCSKSSFWFKTTQIDPRTIQNDPKTIQNDPKTIHNDPRTIQNDPITIQNDPKTIQNDPRTIQNAPERAQNAPERPQNAPERSRRLLLKLGKKSSGCFWEHLGLSGSVWECLGLCGCVWEHVNYLSSTLFACSRKIPHPRGARFRYPKLGSN